MRVKKLLPRAVADGRPYDFACKPVVRPERRSVEEQETCEEDDQS